ncbi:hypothetical protein KCU65_g6851, partial [Aureobasidium melanogenum]
MQLDYSHFTAKPHDRLHTLGLRALDKLLRGVGPRSPICVLVFHDSRGDAERLSNSGLLQHFDYFIDSQVAADEVYVKPGELQKSPNDRPIHHNGLDDSTYTLIALLFSYRKFLAGQASRLTTRRDIRFYGLDFKGADNLGVEIGVFAVWAHDVDFDVDWPHWKSNASHAIVAEHRDKHPDHDACKRLGIQPRDHLTYPRWNARTGPRGTEKVRRKFGNYTYTMSPVSEFVWRDDIRPWFADRMHAIVPGPARLSSPPHRPYPMPSPARSCHQESHSCTDPAPLLDVGLTGLTLDDPTSRGTNVPFPLPLPRSSLPLHPPTVRSNNEWKAAEEKAKAEARRQQIPSLLADGHFLAARTLGAQDIGIIRKCLHRQRTPRVEGISYRKISGEDHDGVLECELEVEGKCLGWMFSGKHCPECDAYMCRPCYDSINTRHARWATDERIVAKDRKFRAKFRQ